MKRWHDTGSPATVRCYHSADRAVADVNRYDVCASLICG